MAAPCALAGDDERNRHVLGQLGAVRAVVAAVVARGERVGCVSVMAVNNETGATNDLRAAAEVVRRTSPGAVVHTDAVQAACWMDLREVWPHVDLLSLSAHKFGGPTGVGALLLRRDVACVPLLHGGGQERDVRSGTVDVAGAVAMAAAAEIAVGARETTAARLTALRDRMIDGVLGSIDDVGLNGARGERRLPGNAHFTFRGCEGDSLLMLLDANGVECSTGSACTAGVAQPSHVLLAMGVEPGVARGSLRLTLGHTSTEADVDAALAVLPAAVERARRAALASSAAGGPR